MKHPVLVRVFAVVLSILCLVMTCAGILGLQKAEDDYNKSISAVDKMRADIAEYKQLLADNEGKEKYDVISEELDKQKEEHDKLSADHRTELATFSATKGGIETGKDALNSAWVAMESGKAQLEAGKAELEAKKASFMEMYNGYYMAVQYLPVMEEQAKNLETVVNSVDPSIPQAMKQELEKRKDDLELEEKALTEADPEKTQIEAWALLEEKKLKLEEDTGIFDAQFAAYYQAVAGLAAIKEQMAPMQMLLAATNPEQLEQGKKALEDAEAQIADAEGMLADASGMLEENFNKIWDEQDKLTDKQAELEKSKEQLIAESEEIKEKEQISKEQKQREKRLKSLYLSYIDMPEVKETVDDGKDFVEAVESYIANFNNEAQQEAKLRGYANVLMIVAILAAIICMLASFEIIKKIPVVRSGAVIVLMFAAAALGIFLWMGRGVSYSAAGVAFFAILQVLVSGRIKKKKA